MLAYDCCVVVLPFDSDLEGPQILGDVVHSFMYSCTSYYVEAKAFSVFLKLLRNVMFGQAVRALQSFSVSCEMKLDRIHCVDDGPILTHVW